ncbi:hypothetical protein PR048_027460, partial [Dryococelus australis]
MLSISIDTPAVDTLNTKDANNHSTMKMPIKELPKFNGDITQWQAFYDLLLTLVHNISLHESSLQSEARALVSILPVTNANYEVARNFLVQRYNLQRLIAYQHLQSIFNTPSVSSDCVQSIKGPLHIVTENIGALKVIDIPTDQWDVVLLHLLV